MITIDGKALAEKIYADLADRVAAQVATGGRPPKMAIVTVSPDSATKLYLGAKLRAAIRVRMEFEVKELETRKNADVAEALTRFNRDPEADGVILQLPLPPEIDSRPLTEMIDSRKDIDCLTMRNLGRVLAGWNIELAPCTPTGIIRLIESTGVQLPSALVAVVGQGHLVGAPLSIMLTMRGATVLKIASKTTDPQKLCRMCDVVVVATGRQGLVTRDWIRPGAVVIDVGLHYTPQGMRGDVDHVSVATIAGALTPVPGGVGPMTVAMLMENCVKAYERRRDR